MANLSITARCNRDCGYCFAMDFLESSQAPASMSLELFERSLDFLARSGIGEARLLGGEPTLHPDFCTMIDRALARGFRLLVFSGGLIPPRALDRLVRVPAEQCSVLINVIPPGEGKRSETEKQRRVFQALGPRAMLGINIARPGTPLDFLLDLIDAFGLARSVRLGLAHPVLAGSNAYLHPRHYPAVGGRVAAFGRAARARNVSLVFDCGWVPCMFPAGSLEELGLGPNDVGLRCNPLLDVLPDGRVISCYPLATHATEQLDSVRDAKALRAAFTKRQADDRAFMLYPHCSTCEYRLSGRCTGGCLAGSLRRLRSSTATFGLPDAHREPIPDAAAATARSATPQPRPRSIPLPVLTGHVAATAAHSPCCN